MPAQKATCYILHIKFDREKKAVPRKIESERRPKVFEITQLTFSTVFLQTLQIIIAGYPFMD